VTFKSGDRSFKLVPFVSLGAVSYSLSIVTISGVVLETLVLVSRRLEDRNGGLGLGLETWSLGLGLNC